MSITSPRQPKIIKSAPFMTTGLSRMVTLQELTEEYNHHVKYDDDLVLSQYFKIGSVDMDTAAKTLTALEKAGATAYLDEYLTIKPEIAKYEPLERFVEAVCKTVVPENFHRVTVRSGNTIIHSDVTLNGLRRPDLVTYDDRDAGHHYNFHYVGAQWEVKVSAQDAPSPQSHRPIIGQIADAVRLRMASRPCQLFTLVIIMCDNRFWVSMWDRDGVVISKEHNLDTRAGRQLFIRVIISLHFNLDLYDLGLDRNVILPEDKHSKGFAYIPSAPDPCPTVKYGGHKWTLAENIFQSITALGRGTSVWRVSRKDEDGKLIERAIKWSWRSPERTSEAQIHADILAAFNHKQPATIAAIDDEYDASLADPLDLVTVGSLRKNLEPTSAPVNDLTLTCIMAKRVGKSIWKYDTDLEILCAVHDLVEGLMALESIGWMHRDISAGNCLLTRDPDDGPSFISDLELAKKPDASALPSGVAISGTAQFMARQVLSSIIKRMPHGHHNRHDLESCVYVLVYAVMKKEHTEFLDKNAARVKEIKKENGDISLIDALTEANKAVEMVLVSQFGHTSFSGIRAARGDLPQAWNDFLRWTTGSEESKTNLHKVIKVLIAAVAEQNREPIPRTVFASGNSKRQSDQKRYRGSTKRPNSQESEDSVPTKRWKAVQDQPQPLDAGEMLDLLESAIEAEEVESDAGEAPGQSDTDGTDA